MIPLRVTAYVSQEISLHHDLALDALLMALVARRDRLPPHEASLRPDGTLPLLPIPIALSPCKRFYLCSHARPQWAEKELRFKNRRPVITELSRYSTAKGTINIATGPNKAYRVPYEAGILRDGRLDWWCIGDRDEIVSLLSLCTSLGRNRGVGLGRVDRWEVEPCETWPGFPVCRDGVPLRPVPCDWPDATESIIVEGVLMPPYSDALTLRSEYVRRAL